MSKVLQQQYQMLFRLFILSFLCWGCSLWAAEGDAEGDTDSALYGEVPSVISPIEEKTLVEIYAEAMALFEIDSFEEAAEMFRNVERQYPYSKWSAHSFVMSAFSYYVGQFYTEAINVGENFLTLYPQHSLVPYIYYLIAECFYGQIPDIEREQQTALQALQAFEGVILRFPHSVYAQESKVKIALIYNQLAAREMYVARFYQKQGDYPSAIKRYQIVIGEYYFTPQIEEALYRLVEVYFALGVEGEALSMVEMLELNYPKSQWTMWANELVTP